MSLLDEVVKLATIALAVNTIVDTREERERKRRDDEKDRKIRDLEERIVRLEKERAP